MYISIMKKMINTNFSHFFRDIIFEVCIIPVYLIALVGCSSKKDAIPQAVDTLLVPCQEVGESTLFCYDGPHLVWKLNSDYSFKTLDDTSSMLVVPVRLTIYDTLDKNITLIFSDSGNTTKDLEKFYIWGNVYIKNWDGLIVKSESLWWNKMSHKVGSDDLVEIRTPEDDILRGRGLDATETFSWWTLRERVSGEFPNFNKRMELDEDL